MEPKQYDLAHPAEQERLIREMRGYLQTCVGEHHGTDKLGRQFAMLALAELVDGRYKISFQKPE